MRKEFTGFLWTGKGWADGINNQQIQEQSPTSLKVTSQLSIDCHQVIPIYNCSSPSQLSACLRLELSNVPAFQRLEHNTKPLLSQSGKQGL